MEFQMSERKSDYARIWLGIASGQVPYDELI